MHTDGRLLSFGGQLFRLRFDSQLALPRLKLEGNQSKIVGVHRGVNDTFLIQTKVRDEFGATPIRANLIAYQADGTLLQQIANAYATPIVANASGWAQITSAVDACEFTQFSANLETRYQRRIDSNNCLLITNSLTNATDFYVAQSAQAGNNQSFWRIQASSGATLGSFVVPMLSSERYCGGYATNGELILASCGPSATRIRKVSAAGAIIWTTELARSAPEIAVRLLPNGQSLLVSSEGTSVSKLDLSTGAMAWNRSFDFPISVVRHQRNRDYVVTAECSAGTPVSACNAGRLHWLLSDGTSEGSASFLASSLDTIEIAECNLFDLCLFYPALSGSDSKLAYHRILGSTLSDSADWVVETTSESFNSDTLIDSHGAHTYVAVSDPTSVGNLRVKKIRNSNGSLVWIKNFDLRSELGDLVEARISAIEANDDLVSLQIEGLVASSPSARPVVIFQRLFATTGARLKPLEWAVSSASIFFGQSRAHQKLDGNNLWISLDQFSNAGCVNVIKRIELDSSESSPAAGVSCGDIAFFSVVNQDLLIANPSQLKRISTTGLVYNAALTVLPNSSFSFEASPDQTRVLVSSSNGSNDRLELRDTQTGALIWSRDKPGNFFTRDLKFLPNNDVVISQLLRTQSVGGVSQLAKLNAMTGTVVWEQNETPRSGIRSSLVSLLPDATGNSLHALRRTLRHQGGTYLDRHLILENRDLSNGALLSQQSLLYANDEGSSLPGGNFFSLSEKIDNSQFLVQSTAFQRSSEGLSIGVINAPVLSQGNLRLVANARRDVSGLYKVVLRASNESSVAVTAGLSMWSTGRGLWFASSCTPACVFPSFITTVGKVLVIPPNGETRVDYDLWLPEASPETITAQLTGTSTHSEPTLLDNLALIVNPGETYLSDGFE
jgi:outer membrane protein assembly factor BamB